MRGCGQQGQESSPHVHELRFATDSTSRYSHSSFQDCVHAEARDYMCGGPNAVECLLHRKTIFIRVKDMSCCNQISRHRIYSPITLIIFAVVVWETISSLGEVEARRPRSAGRLFCRDRRERRICRPRPRSSVSNASPRGSLTRGPFNRVQPARTHSSRERCKTLSRGQDTCSLAPGVLGSMRSNLRAS